MLYVLGLAPTKPVTRVARTQPLVRPADRITALGGNTPSKPTEKSSDCLLSVSSTAESPSLHNGGCQNSTAVKSQKQACEGSPRETEVSVPQRRETYVSSLISDVDLRISTLSPLVYALAEQQNFQPPACNKKGKFTCSLKLFFFLNLLYLPYTVLYFRITSYSSFGGHNP